MSDALIKGRQVSAHRMIQRWGGIGYLVRDGVQRAATMARIEYTAKERGLYADKVSRIRVSIIGLAVPPDESQDTILFKSEQYNIVEPVGGLRLAGAFIYYDCECVFTNDEGTS